MKTIIFKNFYKTIVVSFFIIFVIVGAMITSLSILKEEAVKTHLKIASLHANTFSEQLTQTLNNIELTIDGINSILKKNNDISLLDNRFNTILDISPYIRSISLLDEKQKVIFSSNNKNLGIKLNLEEFLPYPMFDDFILRFGNPVVGRDLVDLKKIKSLSGAKESSFVPLVKMIKTQEEKYYILITLNTDYFINRYADNLHSNNAKIDVMNMNGTLLFSSDTTLSILHKINIERKLIKESFEKSISFGINSVNNKKYLSAYQLSDDYPINVGVRLDYEKSLIQWEEKRSNIILIVSLLLILCIMLVVILIIKDNIEKNNEIQIHKKEVESKKKFEILFEQSIFLASIIKKDASIIEMNHTALEFLNKQMSEVIHKKFFDLDCWDENEATWLKDKIINFINGTKIQKELKIITKNNGERTIDFMLSSIEVDNEIELVLIGIDITERKEWENKLKHAYIVFENTHDGIVITDENVNIINVNRAFTESSGYTLDEVYGLNPRILKSGLHDKEFYSVMWDQINKKGFWEGELTNKRKDGNYYNEWLTINVVHDAKGNIDNYIAVFYDTTKQKAQEKKLKEQEQFISQQSKLTAMGEMLENVAHQWRQPLSVISTLATGIKLKKEFSNLSLEEELKDLDSINNSAQYLSKTIDYFRGFLKNDQNVKLLEITEIVEKSLDLISSKLTNREINIVKETEKFSFEGIENELLQVLMNILNNSIDVHENKDIENKTIFINTFVENAYGVIIIQDNAGGIPEDIISRVFEPYFTTKHKSSGTGIGLYMSQEIITNHMNGYLLVDNIEIIVEKKSYKGAQFKIKLPLK